MLMLKPGNARKEKKTGKSTSARFLVSYVTVVWTVVRISISISMVGHLLSKESVVYILHSEQNCYE